jgi:hypothetical protein
MFSIVRLTLIFVFGAAAVAAIEASPIGAFLMGAASLLLTIWMIWDASRLLQGLAP